MFKLPSLQSVIEGALRALKRFPLVVLCSMVGAGIAMYLIHLDYQEEQDYLFLTKWIMCCYLGVSLFLSLGLIGESRKLDEAKKWGLYALGIGLLVLYFFSLPESGDFDRGGIHHIIRYTLFNIGLHMLVAFAPFIGKGNINGFWQFNKSLFLRFVTAALYSSVLYAGLALALLAVDQLFGADIKGELYGDLWVLMAAVFNTWFFVAGVPDSFEALETEESYPKGLKIFSQFVLLPLVSIYLLILYAYMAKIVVQWELPVGWVSYLVIFFSVAGILSLLLIYPIRNKEGNAWINIYSRWFYRALFPLIVLLFIAIGKRIGDYGITENRYFVLVVALWLAGMAIYFLISKNKNIKLIPITLFCIAFLSSFGPWGAFYVSEKSQLNRMETLLADNNMLENGKVMAATDTLPFEQGKQLVSVVEYLAKIHGAPSMQEFFTVNIDSMIEADSSRYYYAEGDIFEMMGINRSDYYDYYREQDEDGWKHFNYYSDNYNRLMETSGHQYLLQVNVNTNDYREKIDSLGLEVNFSAKGKQLEITRKDSLLISIPMQPEVERMKKHMDNNNKYSQNIASDHAIISAENEKIAFKFYCNSLSGRHKKGEVEMEYMQGMLLLTFKSQ